MQAALTGIEGVHRRVHTFVALTNFLDGVLVDWLEIERFGVFHVWNTKKEEGVGVADEDAVRGQARVVLVVHEFLHSHKYLASPLPAQLKSSRLGDFRDPRHDTGLGKHAFEIPQIPEGRCEDGERGVGLTKGLCLLCPDEDVALLAPLRQPFIREKTEGHDEVWLEEGWDRADVCHRKK